MKILVAIDGSENSLRAARFAQKATLPRKQVTLVYVDTLSVQVKVKSGVIPKNFKDLVEEGRQTAMKNAENFLEKSGSL